MNTETHRESPFTIAIGSEPKIPATGFDCDTDTVFSDY